MNVMSGIGYKNPLVGIFKYCALEDKLPLIIWDVDLTLQPSTCCITTPEQRQLMYYLHRYTHGGNVIASGRKIAAIDQTFGYLYPASGEHHSEMRLTDGGEKFSLAPKGYAPHIAAAAAELIQARLTPILSQSDIASFRGFPPGVFTEEKDHAVALIHSEDHEGVEQVRRVLEHEIAPEVIQKLKIGELFTVKAGRDAIEIVPRGLCPNSKAHGLLAPDQIDLLHTHGLDKGTAVHNFMSLPQNRDRIPFVIGDGEPDGDGMLVGWQYGGGGIWVLNGKTYKPKYAEAVGGRTIEHYTATYGLIAEALPFAEEMFIRSADNFDQSPVEGLQKVAGMHR